MTKHESSGAQVPLLDLKAQFAPLKREIMAAIEAVCDDQRFILGPRVRQLEEELAVYSGTAHGVGVSSGTDALLVALMALGISAGDEVVTTPFTFFATAGCISRLGARPVFCDIRPDTFNLDPDAVDTFLAEQCERRAGGLVNKRTGARVRAMIPVHLFGQMADMQRMMVLAHDYDLRVVEDAAQAIGSKDAAGCSAGGVGDIGCFSFFPSKNLGAFGDAGMCVTNDPELADRMRILRGHGARPKYMHAMIGGNFRLDEIQAAVLSVKLRHLDDWSEARRRNAETYTELLGDRALAGHVIVPHVSPGGRHVYNQYVIRAKHRDGLRAALSEAGVSTEIYYPRPMHMQTCYQDLGMRPEDCAESARAADEALALPIYPELTEEQQRHVVAEIVKYYG